MSDRSIEKAGVLRGFHQGDQTIITGFIGLEASYATGGAVTFSADMWAEANRLNDSQNTKEGSNDSVMGWFHTHPRDYPPIPLSADDRLIMSAYFPESGKTTPGDRTTIIMTTQSNDPAEILAAWKWDKDNNRAVLLRGLGIAKNSSSEPTSRYFTTTEEARNVIGQLSVDIQVSKSDMPSKGEQKEEDGVSIEKNEEEDMLRITLDDMPDEVLRLTTEDLGQEEILRLNLDDVTPAYAQALIKHINKNPDSKNADLMRKILQATQKVMPAKIVEDIDLILKQPKSTSDQIKIL